MNFSSIKHASQNEASTSCWASPAKFSFLKKHALLTEYIVFSATLCAGLAALAALAAHGLPLMLAGL